MKDATVSARVELDVKNEAEEILRQLWIPVSVVINALYRQIIFQGGIPFNAEDGTAVTTRMAPTVWGSGTAACRGGDA